MTRVEYVVPHVDESLWVVPSNPPIPETVTDKAVARFILDTRDSLDSCRANLGAVRNLWESAVENGGGQ